MLSDLAGLPVQLGKVGLLTRMKVLLYGMQSSGASAVAFTLAQKPDSVAFVDIWNMFAAPELETERDSVAKVVVTTAFSLEVHKRRFRPDVTVLVLRHPTDTYDSLIDKTYANESGLIDEKFAALEKVFVAGTEFDHIVYYEDFVFSPQSVVALFDRMGWQIGCDALLFGRTQREIEEANVAACPGIHGRLKYGIGNIQTRGVLRDRVRFAEAAGRSAGLRRLCPSVFDHYSALRAERSTSWHVPAPALLSCNLGAILRALSKSGVIPQHSEQAGYRMQLTNGTPQCRVTDTSLVLSPAAQGEETQLSLSGLPGQPFNRICGVVCAEHPRTLGTKAQVQIVGTDGECLAEQEFTLSHFNMRSIDLKFEPRVSGTELRLGVSLAQGVESADHGGVCIQDLRLEQVAE